jgi:hypothetical protein
MSKGRAVPWEFTRRLRRGAFGWKSPPAIQRVKQAVSEIKKVARRDPVLGAEGAVLFLERVSPALAQVDGSSGAIGNAVNHAVEELAAIIAQALVSPATASAWADRLVPIVEMAWSPDPERRGFFHGTTPCFSALLRAGRAARLKLRVRIALQAFRIPRRRHSTPRS